MKTTAIVLDAQRAQSRRPRSSWFRAIPDGSVTVYLGHGRDGTSATGYAWTTQACRLQRLHAAHVRPTALRSAGLNVSRGTGTYDLCVTKVHAMENRGSLRAARSSQPKVLSNKQGAYSLPGHEAMERAIIRYATLGRGEGEPRLVRTAKRVKTTRQDAMPRATSPARASTKIGYNPQGETPEHDLSMFPDSVGVRPSRRVEPRAAEQVGHGDRPATRASAATPASYSLLGGKQHPRRGREQVKDRPQYAVAAHRHVL